MWFLKQDEHRVTVTEGKGSESERKIQLKSVAHQPFCLFVILLCRGQAPWAVQSKV